MLCLFIADDIAWAQPADYPASKSATLAASTVMADAQFKEKAIAMGFLLAADGVDRYIREQIAKEKGIFGKDWQMHRTETLNINNSVTRGRIKYNVRGLESVVLVKVSGLFASTEQFAHVGLSGKDYNSLPVIYIDSAFANTPDKCVQKHDIDEILQWENFRLNFLHIGTRGHMRRWIVSHIDKPDEELKDTEYEGKTSREIAKLFHKNSYPLDSLSKKLKIAVDYRDADADAYLDYEYLRIMLSLYGTDEESSNVNIAAGGNDSDYDKWQEKVKARVNQILSDIYSTKPIVNETELDQRWSKVTEKYKNLAEQFRKESNAKESSYGFAYKEYHHSVSKWVLEPVVDGVYKFNLNIRSPESTSGGKIFTLTSFLMIFSPETGKLVYFAPGCTLEKHLHTPGGIWMHEESIAGRLALRIFEPAYSRMAKHINCIVEPYASREIASKNNIKGMIEIIKKHMGKAGLKEAKEKGLKSLVKKRQEDLAEGKITIEKLKTLVSERVVIEEMRPENDWYYNGILSYKDLDISSPIDLLERLVEIYPHVEQLLLEGKMPDKKTGENLFSLSAKQLPAPAAISNLKTFLDTPAFEELKGYLASKNLRNSFEAITKAVQILTLYSKEGKQILLELCGGDTEVAHAIAKNNKDIGVLILDLYNVNHEESEYANVAKQFDRGELKAQKRPLENLVALRGDQNIFKYLPDECIDCVLLVAPSNLEEILAASGIKEKIKPSIGKIIVKPYAFLKISCDLDKLSKEVLFEGYLFKNTHSSSMFGVDIDKKSAYGSGETLFVWQKESMGSRELAAKQNPAAQAADAGENLQALEAKLNKNDNIIARWLKGDKRERLIQVENLSTEQKTQWTNLDVDELVQSKNQNGEIKEQYYDVIDAATGKHLTGFNGTELSVFGLPIGLKPGEKQLLQLKLRSAESENTLPKNAKVRTFDVEDPAAQPDKSKEKLNSFGGQPTSSQQNGRSRHAEGPALFLDPGAHEIRELTKHEHNALHEAFRSLINFTTPESGIFDKNGVRKITENEARKLIGQELISSIADRGPSLDIYIIDDVSLAGALPKRHKRLASCLITHAGTWREDSSGQKHANLFIPRSIYNILFSLKADSAELLFWRHHEIEHLINREEPIDSVLAHSEKELAHNILAARNAFQDNQKTDLRQTDLAVPYFVTGQPAQFYYYLRFGLRKKMHTLMVLDNQDRFTIKNSKEVQERVINNDNWVYWALREGLVEKVYLSSSKRAEQRILRLNKYGHIEERICRLPEPEEISKFLLLIDKSYFAGMDEPGRFTRMNNIIKKFSKYGSRLELINLCGMAFSRENLINAKTELFCRAVDLNIKSDWGIYAKALCQKFNPCDMEDFLRRTNDDSKITDALRWFLTESARIQAQLGQDLLFCCESTMGVSNNDAGSLAGNGTSLLCNLYCGTIWKQPFNILRAAGKMDSSKRERALTICRWVQKNILPHPDATIISAYNTILRQAGSPFSRTNAQIALLRAEGIRCRFVLDNIKNGLTSHIFAELFIDNKWLRYDLEHDKDFIAPPYVPERYRYFDTMDNWVKKRLIPKSQTAPHYYARRGNKNNGIKSREDWIKHIKTFVSKIPKDKEPTIKNVANVSDDNLTTHGVHNIFARFNISYEDVGMMKDARGRKKKATQKIPAAQPDKGEEKQKSFSYINAEGPALFVDPKTHALRELTGDEHWALRGALIKLIDFSRPASTDVDDKEARKLTEEEVSKLIGRELLSSITGRGPPAIYIVDDTKLTDTLPLYYKYLAEGLITHAGTWRRDPAGKKHANLFIPKSIYNTLISSSLDPCVLKFWRHHEIEHLAHRTKPIDQNFAHQETAFAKIILDTAVNMRRAVPNPPAAQAVDASRAVSIDGIKKHLTGLNIDSFLSTPHYNARWHQEGGIHATLKDHLQEMLTSLNSIGASSLPGTSYPELISMVKRQIKENRDELEAAILTHDLGKKETVILNTHGNRVFHRHEEKSYELLRKSHISYKGKPISAKVLLTAKYHDMHWQINYDQPEEFNRLAQKMTEDFEGSGEEFGQAIEFMTAFSVIDRFGSIHEDGHKGDLKSVAQFAAHFKKWWAQTAPAAQPTPRALKAVIFDLDGVIVTLGAHFEAWKEVLSKREVELSWKEFIKRFNGTSSTYMASTLFPDAGKAQIVEIAQEKDDIYKAIIEKDGIEKYESTITKIRELRKQGFKLAVASNGFAADDTLKSLGMRDLFDEVIMLKDVTHEKPNPEMFLLAAKKMSVSPSETAVVGDSKLDMKAAKDGGFGAAIALNRGGADSDDIAGDLKQAGATDVFNDMSEVSIDKISKMIKNNLQDPSAQLDAGDNELVRNAVVKNPPGIHLGPITQLSALARQCEKQLGVIVGVKSKVKGRVVGLSDQQKFADTFFETEPLRNENQLEIYVKGPHSAAILEEVADLFVDAFADQNFLECTGDPSHDYNKFICNLETRIKRPISAQQPDAGEIENALYMMNKAIPAQLKDGKCYEVRYDSAKLREYQAGAGLTEENSPEELLKEYIRCMQMRVNDDRKPQDVIKLQEFNGKTDKGECLVSVTCYEDKTKEKIIGKGQVNIKDLNKETTMQMVGMLNMAFAASHIPAGANLSDYENLVSFLKSQYKDLTGDELLPERIWDIIELPGAKIIPAESLAEYYRLIIEQLRQNA